LKPIDADELKASITKFKQRSSSQFPDISSIIQEINSNKNYRSRFLLTKGDSLIPIETSDIAWIIAEDKLVFLIQNSGNKSLFPFTLDELTTQLNPIDFFRINRSVIAHRNSIQKAELHFNGKIKIHLNPSTESEQFVSREKAASFKDWWGS
jgi:DNA-binding LytR/AlgR family response regulator